MPEAYKYLSEDEWYGGGYCNICGSTTYYPKAIRYWDCDDGWRIGVLCNECTSMLRGPKEDDYAYADSQSDGHRDSIDLEAQLGDLDATYSEWGM